MVTLAALWLPILVSAILVFFASSLFHMVLPFHRSDYRKVPSEDAVMNAASPWDCAWRLSRAAFAHAGGRADT